MAEALGKMSGVHRAAILLYALGEQEAAEILRRLEPKEVQALSKAMASLPGVSRAQVGAVLHAFGRAMRSQAGLGGSDDYVRKVLTRALGEDRASRVLDRILGTNPKGLEPLKWMEPAAVAGLVRAEHPQIIAMVLTYLDPEQAGQVLAHFPEKQQGDILLRVATLDRVQPAALQDLHRIVENGFSGPPPAQHGRGGAKTAAEILNVLKAPVDGPLMAYLKEKDAELAQKVESLTVVFEDLLKADDRGIQALLREVSSEALLLALKGADEAVKEKILKNMSKRAAEMMRDDLEAKGPVRLAEVEEAQKEIMKIARKLSESGELVLGDQSGEFV